MVPTLFEMDLNDIIDLYYSGAITEDNEKKIREYFMQSYIAPSPSVSSDRIHPKFMKNIPQKKLRTEDENLQYYKSYMYKELEKYKERLKLAKNEVVNDFKPLKRNPNEVLLDIAEEFIINKSGNWANLCILEYQERLLQVIRTNQVTIVKGFTGCGKSTQIPQYIAVDCQNRGQSYNIIVTQPRRVAAKMLATRVSYELNCTVGSLVGYQIGLDRSRDSKLTKILYCTTGVLLQRLIMSSTLNFFTHIILDEIHERSADMDMLFLILKKKIFEGKLNAKIILMSATCDVDLFQHYFTFPEYVISSDCFVDICPAIVEINSSRDGTGNVFRQEIFYLDDIVGKIGTLKFNYLDNILRYTDFDDFLMNNAEESIIFNKHYPFLHKILHEVVLAILFHGIEIHQGENQSRGTVLIFLPGLAEILELLNILKTSAYAIRYKWKFFILHSTVSLKEQTEVMKTSIDGSRHIILATNIAESSLTVPNVEFVIDFCLCKTLIASRQGYNMSYLALEWSSKSSSDQRAGRTGRTNHGQVFRLIPNHFYQTLHEYEIPEFEKTPLENYVLKAKLIDQNLPPKEVLAYALNPPKLQDIEQAVLTLKRVGAFTVYVQKENEEDYHYDEENGNLTALGYVMALLPLDIMLSKLVSLGLVFDVTYEAIVIASAHCTTGFFMKNAYDPIHTYKSHLSWSNRSLSDSLAYLKAYRMYKTLESKFNNNSILAQKWCFKNNIEYQRLLELETLISEITTRLEMNLKIDLNFYKRSFYKKSEQDLILKVVIAGAFYPNYFTRNFVQEDILDRYQTGVNTENTVVLTGFCKDSLVTSLYIPFLKKIFEPCSSKIDFKIDCSTVFMIFDTNNHEISIENEDHPLHLAYNSHINSQQISQTKFAGLKNWSSFSETNIHTSVYLALALKKFMRNQITLNRYRSTIETFHKKEILTKIKINYELFDNEDTKKNWSLQENNLIANVCQNARKYLLPKMPLLKTSTTCIGVRICHFITPHFFFVLYKHSYVMKMLYNIDVLTAALVEKASSTASTNSVIQYSKFDRSSQSSSILAPTSLYSSSTKCSSELANLEVGDFVIAPLNIERFNALQYVAKDYDITIYNLGGNNSIMARAEILKISHYNYKPMACLYFVDFGITDTLALSNIFKLSCRFKFAVQNVLRETLKETDLQKIKNPQEIFDKLFCIPPLAVRCELVRIKPFSGVELVGNWMPQVKSFMADYCKRYSFTLTAKIYAYLNERLYIDLYPGNRDEGTDLSTTSASSTALELYEDESRHISLNELLVQKKFAEFKLETDICQQKSIRRDLNYYHEISAKDINPIDEFPLNFDGDILEKNEFQFDVDQLNINSERQFTHNLIRIRGPMSPLEVKFCGISKMNSMKNINISAHSINSVALEPDITAKHARLLVSGEINLSESDQNRLSLSNTTLMPNLIDFPSFMCLLFSPFVELRVNKLVNDRSFGMPEEVCGAICGLGFHPNNQSYDPDNDIDLFFDSSVNLADIELINLLRYQISQFFYAKEQHINCYHSDAMKMESTFSLEQNLFKRQKKCRQILFQLLNRTRLKRKWFAEEHPEAPIYPDFVWNNFKAFPYREFHFKEFSQLMLKTINLKTAVLTPIALPIINPDDSVTEWENQVLENLTSFDNGDIPACYDEKTKLYICKLCMFCTFSDIEIEQHRGDSSNIAHKEAAYLFKRYYPIWKEEFDQLKQFTTEIIQEERQPDRPLFADVFEYEGSSFACLDYQLSVLSKLGPPGREVECKDLYDAPVITNQDQKNMHMSQLNTLKNPFTLSSLKRKVETVIEQDKAQGEKPRTIQSLNPNVYQCLAEYFDDDEISLLNNLNLLNGAI